MNERIELISQFEGGITEGLQEKLKQIAQDHIEKFSESYFKKIFNKDDAQGRISMHITLNKQERYEGKFNFSLDSRSFYRQNDVPFKEPLDLVNHAFKHLKEHLAKE